MVVLLRYVQSNCYQFDDVRNGGFYVMREHRHDLQEYVDFTELQGFREMCTSSLQ
jgi:hypothetical protein